MYKVFINDKEICFTNNVESCNPFSNGLVLNFFTPDITVIILELLDNDSKLDHFIFEVNDFELAFKDFQTCFKLIHAAGGIVHNSEGEKLFIYRLDKWDLPKGKVEKNEGIEEAAIREVEEECGINGLTILKPLNDTYHVYKLKNKLILKRTFWFDMKTTYQGKLTPQLEENITKAEWLTDTQITENVLDNTYASIRELLNSII